VCVSPDGTTVVAGHADGSLSVWDISSEACRLVRSLAYEGVVTALAWSPDGLRVAAAGGDTIVVWDPWTGRATRRLPSFPSASFALAFSPNGLELYASGGAGEVDVWDLTSGERKRTFCPDEPFDRGFPPRLIALAHDGSWLAVAASPWRVRVIDTRSGQPIAHLPPASRDVDDIRVTHDGRLMTSSEGTVRFWDADTWQEVASLIGPSGLVSQSQDGSSLICVTTEARTLTAWNMHDHTLTGRVTLQRAPLALAVHGRDIWVGCDDGTIVRYEYRP
jgi:WD40 repeat protein